MLKNVSFNRDIFGFLISDDVTSAFRHSPSDSPSSSSSPFSSSLVVGHIHFGSFCCAR